MGSFGFGLEVLGRHFTIIDYLSVEKMLENISSEKVLEDSKIGLTKLKP